MTKLITSYIIKQTFHLNNRHYNTQEIAEKLKISDTTVSNILNKKGKYSTIPEEFQRIDTGYRYTLRKFQDGDILEIRRLYEEEKMSAYKLGIKYDTTPSNIQKIVNNKTYKDV